MSGHLTAARMKAPRADVPVAMKWAKAAGWALFWMMSTVLAGDYAFITSPRVMELVNARRTPPADWRERSGAVFVNEAWEKDPGVVWYVEMQRDGGRWVESGLAHGNTEAVEWGLKQLEWGFARMKEDGSFDCGDPFHSASFLVETSARSILLIEASPMADRFKPRLEGLKRPLLMGARWIASPANHRAAESQRIYGHRRFLLGCGLAQCARIHDDEALRRTAAYFIEDGVRMQRGDGAFPEKGGHDSSYHAVALIYLQRILLLTPEESRPPSWTDAARRGADWLASRIDTRGVVGVKGNTRTGSGQEVGRSGRPKTVNRPEVATALLYRGRLGGGEKFDQLATLVLRAPADS
jgi:hypothetical protein